MLEVMLATALNIQGAWFKPCEGNQTNGFIQQNLHVMGSQWVRDIRYNLKNDCSGEDYLAVRQVFKISAEEPRLDFETVEIYYEPMTLESAALLNSTAYCGLTDWKKLSPRIVTGKNCGGTVMPSKAQKFYSIYRFQPRRPSDLLWVGEATGNADGNSPENRHIIFELYAFERK